MQCAGSCARWIGGREGPCRIRKHKAQHEVELDHGVSRVVAHEGLHHKKVQIPVEHRLRVGAFDIGAQIVHQLIRLQHVAADAPAGIGLGHF